MDRCVAIVWRAFLDKLPLERKAELLTYLSEPDKAFFQEPAAAYGDPSSGLSALEEELPRVHYTWLAPFLRSQAGGDIKLFMGCLSSEQFQGLKHVLLFANHPPELSLMARTYFRQTLWGAIAGQELLPLNCLPASPLNSLLDLSAAELTTLIELLSMRDLAVEIRQIIETAKLQKIYSLLSKAQTAYLKTLLHTKEAVTFKKMELMKWDGNKELFLALLTQRGINRLAKALYTEDESLRWYIAHRLESERGSMLLKLCSPLDHAGASSILSEQIVELIQTFKNHNPAGEP